MVSTTMRLSRCQERPRYLWVEWPPEMLLMSQIVALAARASKWTRRWYTATYCAITPLWWVPGSSIPPTTQRHGITLRLSGICQQGTNDKSPAHTSMGPGMSSVAFDRLCPLIHFSKIGPYARGITWLTETQWGTRIAWWRRSAAVPNAGLAFLAAKQPARRSTTTFPWCEGRRIAETASTSGKKDGSA